jgi:hypothetical protein
MLMTYIWFGLAAATAIGVVVRLAAQGSRIRYLEGAVARLQYGQRDISLAYRAHMEMDHE